jgi:hypothetical protein
MMFIPDHKPALAMAVSSATIAIAHAAGPTAVMATPHVGMIVMIDEWVRLIGGIAGALAGFASATWYMYSFLKARKSK